MTTPASGAISIADLNTEMGNSSTAQLALGQTATRLLAGVPSGAISLADCYSKNMWWRPTSATITSAVTGGWGTNLANAYDGTSVALEGSTSASIGKNASGVYELTESVNFEAWGTGTFSGTFYVVASGQCSDSAVSAISTIQMLMNGNDRGTITSDLTGTPVTFSFTTGSPNSFYEANVNLATLVITITCSGGRVVLGDTASSDIALYDLIFVRG